MKTATQLVLSSCLKPIIGTTTLLALCVICSADALAGSQVDASVTRSSKVSIADLDLSTPQGARAARERFRQTARKLCAQAADELDLSHHANYLACVDDTVAAALKEVQEGASASGTTLQAKSSTTPGKPVAARYSRAAKVSLADLDLATPEGARAAHERLHQEARRLCSEVADDLDLSRQANYVACIDESVAKAMQQVALPSTVAGATATSAPESFHISDLAPQFPPV
jgi:UrcA family protein